MKGFCRCGLGESSLSAAMRPDKLIVSFCRPDRFFAYPSGFGQKNSSNPLTATKKPLVICGCSHAVISYSIPYSVFIFTICPCQAHVPDKLYFLLSHLLFYRLLLPFRIFLTCLHLDQFKLLIYPQYQPVFQITFHVKSILLVIIRQFLIPFVAGDIEFVA